MSVSPIWGGIKWYVCYKSISFLKKKENCVECSETQEHSNIWKVEKEEEKNYIFFLQNQCPLKILKVFYISPHKESYKELIELLLNFQIEDFKTCN